MPPQRPESVSGPAPGSAATLPPQGTYPIPSAAMATLPPDPRLQSNPFFGEKVASSMDTPRSAGQGHVGARAYQNALKLAKSQIGAGDHAAALATLSVFFRSEDLTPEEHRELVDLLDPLAARVVYSREHLLERPYSVRRDETLADIAQQYNVPAPLLQKINGIENPNVLLPGSELKVVQGPFRADVDLKSQELTLFLDRLYAGRFPIALGIDPQPIEGQFQVRDKRPGKTFFSLDGRTIPEESPSNPFGALGSIWEMKSASMAVPRKAVVRTAAVSASARATRTMSTASCRSAPRFVSCAQPCDHLARVQMAPGNLNSSGRVTRDRV